MGDNVLHAELETVRVVKSAIAPLSVTENGTYEAHDSVDGYSPVTVDVQPNTEALSVTENGTYTPPQGVDGYAPVEVDVQPTLESLTVTENGTYTPPQGVDGYNDIVVNVGGGGDDKPDLTKAPVPSGSPNLWAYLLIDNSLDGFPKSVNGVFTGIGTTWERGYLDENNEFVVETTQTEPSNTGITIDYSDVVRRWVIYRMQSNNMLSTYNWSRTLYQLPVIAVRGWCEASATSTIRGIAPPPQGGFGQFPQLRELYWGGVVFWTGQYSAPTRWLEVIDFSKVTDFRSNIINFNYSIDYMENLRELKLPKLQTRVPVSSTANSGFIWGSSLISLDLSMFDFTGVIAMGSFFQYMLSLETLNLSGVDFTAQGTATTSSITFDQAYHLKNLILDNATLWRKNTSFAWSPLLTHESLVALIAALPTLDGITRTLTLHPDALARLSAAEIAVANGKGWTVS